VSTWRQAFAKAGKRAGAKLIRYPFAAAVRQLPDSALVAEEAVAASPLVEAAVVVALRPLSRVR